MIKKFLPALISFLIFGIFILLPPEVIKKDLPFKITTSNGANLNETTFKGRTIQSVMFNDNKYYPIFGSSELEKLDPFHPMHVFKQLNVGKTPFLIGTGGSTDLIHAINIGSRIGEIKDKKFAIIISPQWFTKTGIEDNNFSARYSQLQLDYFLNNPNVPDKLKRRMSTRLLDFTMTKKDPLVRSYAYNQPKIVDEEATITDSLYSNLLEKNDIVKSKMMTPHNRFRKVDQVDLKGQDWYQIRETAVEYGSKQATNNPYFMRNKYWNMIQHHKKKLYRPDEFYVDSKEFEDFQLLLDVLKASKADPLIISIPANGKWYDHIGIDSKKRWKVYDKIHAMVDKEGFDFYDATNKEYEPYFLSDAVHIGWKGWAYIDEQMIRHINNKSIQFN